MADVGDEVGEGIKRGMNRVLSEVFREWLREHMGKRPAPGQEYCTAPLDDPELTRVVTEALDVAEIPYEIKRQSLTVGSDGQLHERATLLFDANDFDRVREVMDAKLEEVKAAERAEGRDLGKATISLQNDEQTQAVTAALEAEGIPYKVERTTLATDKKGVVARATVIFPETEFDRVRAIAEKVLPKKGEDGHDGGRGGHEGPADHDDHDGPDDHDDHTPPPPAGPMDDITPKKEYTIDIRAIADGARAGAATYGEFLDRCRAAGLGVKSTSDGMVKFTHPDHPWFEVRADTLGREFTESAFKSHDGADVDTRTGVVESVVDTPGDATATREEPDENMPGSSADKSREEPEDGEVGIDLDAEAKEARETSAGLEQECKGIDIGRDGHIIPPIDR